jgi:EpsD family peptidyl-prolyl cis-trans isomerase
MLSSSGSLARHASVALGLAVTLLVGACSRSSDSGDSSQVVATVNEREITESQLNQALASINPAGPGAVSDVDKRKALDQLINEELLVQQATSAQLDRDPVVVRSIEETRRRVLAQAYAQRNILPKGDIDLSEQQQFYRNNPLMFEQRRLYQFALFTTAVDQISPAVKSELETTHNPEEVRRVLDRHQIRYSSEEIIKGAEELPEEQRAPFSRLTVGDVALVNAPDKIFLAAITNVVSSPIDFQQASQRINQYLIAIRDRKVLDDKLKEYRAVAKISYSGSTSATAIVSSIQSPDQGATKNGLQARQALQ